MTATVQGLSNASLPNSRAKHATSVDEENLEKPKQQVSGKNRKHFLKTELCRFYPRCKKGDECPFAHSEVELQDQPDLTKTALCTAWRRGRCPHESGACKFAHGVWELRDPTAIPGAPLRDRPRRTARSAFEVLPIVPIVDSSSLKERISEQTSTGGSSDTQSESGSDRMASFFTDFPNYQDCGGMSRQVSTFTEFPNYQDCGGISRQVSCDGMSRQVSNFDEMNRQASFEDMSRQVSNFDGMCRQISCERMSRQVSCDGMSRQMTPVAALMPVLPISQQNSHIPQMSPTQPMVTMQVPVVMKMGTLQMPMLASMSHMTPQAMTITQSQIEKALLEAAPAHYED